MSEPPRPGWLSSDDCSPMRRHPGWHLRRRARHRPGSGLSAGLLPAC